MMQGSECAVQCQDATSAKAIGASIHFFFQNMPFISSKQGYWLSEILVE